MVIILKKGVLVILYILDIKKIRNRYLISSIITLIFGFIYELFSHNVISNHMVFAFIIPFIGFIIYYLLDRGIIKRLPNNISNKLFSYSIISFTICSIIKGVLDIYGTSNIKIYVYLILGIILLICSIVSYIKE